MRRSLTLAILALSAACLSSGAARAASFDCDAKELKPDEKVICDNRMLNDADVKMTTTFDLLSGLLAMGSRGTLQDEQMAWLKKRQECRADAACIKAAYDERMKQLGETYKNINRPL
ncbi:lysozyme inhibitor LprI family protein [Rhizobium yanglingense]